MTKENDEIESLNDVYDKFAESYINDVKIAYHQDLYNAETDVSS